MMTKHTNELIPLTSLLPHNGGAVSLFSSVTLLMSAGAASALFDALELCLLSEYETAFRLDAADAGSRAADMSFGAAHRANANAPATRAALLARAATELISALYVLEQDEPLRQAMALVLPETVELVGRLCARLSETKRADIAGGMSSLTGSLPHLVCFRHPYDDVKTPVSAELSLPSTQLCVCLLYGCFRFFSRQMLACSVPSDRLYAEAGLILSRHAALFASLLPAVSVRDRAGLFLDALRYLVYSAHKNEEERKVKRFYKRLIEQADALRLPAQSAVLAKPRICPAALPLLALSSAEAKRRLPLVRALCAAPAKTGVMTGYADIDSLPPEYPFFTYNSLR